ncbi:MAG: hypothetical protein IJ825_03600, partial [Oscillospiraceae bacterium]|nr:hypothetical protein [Oscillospiraceae bacterium]
FCIFVSIIPECRKFCKPLDSTSFSWYAIVAAEEKAVHKEKRESHQPKRCAIAQAIADGFLPEKSGTIRAQDPC